MHAVSIFIVKLEEACKQHRPYPHGITQEQNQHRNMMSLCCLFIVIIGSFL
jgi:hypothetical protein